MAGAAPTFIHDLMSGKTGRLMGLRVSWAHDPASMAIIFSIQGKQHGTQFLIPEHYIALNPAAAEQQIIQACDKLIKLENQHGLSGQSTTKTSSYPSTAQSGNRSCGFCGNALTAGICTTISCPHSFYIPLSVKPGAINPGGLSIAKLQQAQAALQAASEPEPPVRLPHGGFKLGELIGWRGWRVKNGFLHSMSADVVWAPREIMDGKTKANDEHCGIFAYKKQRDFLKAHPDLEIYGKVAMWGDVIEHELGYRAESAKIISFDAVNRTNPLVDAKTLREIYGVTPN